MRNFATTIKISLIIMFIVIIGGYALYESRNLIEGPILTILEPENGSTSKKAITNIKGKATNISFITMNDKQIFVDDEGVFNEKLVLSEGYNAIKLSAKDKFGRETTKKLEIVYKTREASVATRHQSANEYE